MLKRILNRVQVGEANLAHLRHDLPDEVRSHLVCGYTLSHWLWLEETHCTTLTVFHQAGRACVRLPSGAVWGAWDDSLSLLVPDEDGKVCYLVEQDDLVEVTGADVDRRIQAARPQPPAREEEHPSRERDWRRVLATRARA